MKVLWITNVVFPEALRQVGSDSELKASGGWLIGAAREIFSHSEIDLIIASVSDKTNKLTKIKGTRVTYYLIPFGRGNEFINNEYDKYWREIEALENPEIVHIHGTEYTHGLSYIRTCSNKSSIIISIQGLTSVICDYYRSGLSVLTILRNLTIHDMLIGGILSRMRAMRKRGQYEKEMIQSVSHVIGRTSFDRSYVKLYNPSVNYYHCNETLRPEFYDGRWNYSQCRPYTIFLSQSSQPFKGVHIVFRALPLIRQRFPNVKVRIAGYDTSQLKSIKDIKYYTGYGRILKSLCKKYELGDCVSFLGCLSGEEIKNEYLSSNVFVCPSSIENSPNSLCEAQLLGVPCVASYVGGVPDLITNHSMGLLYRFDDYVMLADKICEVFLKSPEFDNALMIETAKKRHNPEINYQRLLEIYYTVSHLDVNNNE